MKTIIYYFTGTGNSLAAAKKIAAVPGETELVPVASFADDPGDITPAAERIGIVCPVYFTGLPAMVERFAERLCPAAGGYVFAAVTHGGGGGVPALHQLDGILRHHALRGLDAGFAVKMPGNYILMYESPKGEKQKKILDSARDELDRIAESVRQCRKVAIPRSIFGQIVHALIYRHFISRVRGEDKKFSVSEACTGCGTCAAVCPAKNIELVNKKPVWNHTCELCCSCIHNCPVQAIQAGTKTEKRQRYRNPDITLAELKVQRGDTPE